LATENGILYLGGTFGLVQSTLRNRLAAVSLSTGAVQDWDPNVSGQVNALTIAGGRLYAGAPFNS
jgi:hypothetical protein